VVITLALSLPFYGHTWNLFMHVFGAVVFMGNIIVTAAWASLARRSRNIEALRLGVRGIVITDSIFTVPGALLVLLNGGIIGTPYFRAHATWLFVSIGLFLASGVVWGSVLVPIQKRLSSLMKATPGGASIPPEAELLLKRWFQWGGVATLLPLLVLALMVFKPAL
jgi:uncharacterized membrane protein